MPASRPNPTADVRRTLRALQTMRAAFCVVWMILPLMNSPGRTTAGRPTVSIAILLAAYPAVDPS